MGLVRKALQLLSVRLSWGKAAVLFWAISACPSYAQQLICENAQVGSALREEVLCRQIFNCNKFDPRKAASLEDAKIYAKSALQALLARNAFGVDLSGLYPVLLRDAPFLIDIYAEGLFNARDIIHTIKPIATAPETSARLNQCSAIVELSEVPRLAYNRALAVEDILKDDRSMMMLVVAAQRGQRNEIVNVLAVNIKSRIDGVAPSPVQTKIHARYVVHRSNAGGFEITMTGFERIN